MQNRRTPALRRATWFSGATLAWNLDVGGAAVATAIASSSPTLIAFGDNAVVDSSVCPLLVWRFHAQEARDVTRAIHTRRADRASPRPKRQVTSSCFAGTTTRSRASPIRPSETSTSAASSEMLGAGAPVALGYGLMYAVTSRCGSSSCRTSQAVVTNTASQQEHFDIPACSTLRLWDSVPNLRRACGSESRHRHHGAAVTGDQTATRSLSPAEKKAPATAWRVRQSGATLSNSLLRSNAKSHPA